MSNVNKIILVGELGREPELKHTVKNHPYTTLSLATNRKFKDATGADRKEVDWHKIYVWGNHAENCVKYLRTGSRIYVEGELRFRSIPEEGGKERRLAEVHADTVTFLGDSRRHEAASATAAPEETENALAMAN